MQNTICPVRIAPIRIEFVREGARELYLPDNGPVSGLSPATAMSVGFDLRACVDEGGAVIPAGERLLIPAGIAVQPVAEGVAGFVYSRSGLGAREGLTVAQGVGIIDPDYTGEIMVYLLNTSREARTIARGERMAQLVFQPWLRPQWQEGGLAATARGTGGFGHTGR